MATEIEVKIAVEDADVLVDRLRSLGARLVHARCFEDNRLYDRDGGALAAAGKLLRLRRSGDRALLTAKAPSEGAAERAEYKVRHEVETEVPDAEAMAGVLEAAGFTTAWRYQKYRTTWNLDDTVVTLDEIPHGCFLEIEGAPERIDSVAAALGLDRARYRTDSYADIHAQWCAEQGRPLDDMVFADAPPPERSE